MNRNDYLELIIEALKENEIDHSILTNYIENDNLTKIEDFFAIFCPVVFRQFYADHVAPYESIELLKDAIIEYGKGEYE